MTSEATETVQLTGWGPLAELGGSVRALLFGAMIERAIPVMQEYLSDLYHDANWLTEKVTTPITFDWVVRRSGTNIADTARVAIKIGSAGAVFYRIRVYAVKGMWYADFTNVPLDEVEVDRPYEETSTVVGSPCGMEWHYGTVAKVNHSDPDPDAATGWRGIHGALTSNESGLCDECENEWRANYPGRPLPTPLILRDGVLS